MLSEPPRSPYKEWYQTHQYFWFLHCRRLWSRRDGRSHLHSQHKSFPSESSYCVLGRCYPDAMHHMFRMVKWALLWTAAYKCVHVLPLELKLHLRTMYLESYFLRSRKIIRSFLIVYCGQTLSCTYVFSSLNCTSMYCCCLVWMIQGKSQWLRSNQTFPKSFCLFPSQKSQKCPLFW